jgi:ABC-type Mn2+/Zn2+ transport system ATPase subunit
MSVIDLDRATIEVGGRPVLSDVSLSIDAGEFVGVLGPNGSGKTTLMRALLGLGRVDGFDQDEAESKRDERAVILRRLLASKCDTLEPWRTI